MARETRAPEDLRRAVAAYVAAAHHAYTRAARLLPPALAGGLPLFRAGEFWVLAVATRDLHVIGTTQPLPPRREPEVEVEGADGSLRWRLRFYDPVVLPPLSLISEEGAAACEAVRLAAGVRTWLYHLVVEPGSQLDEHRAGHTGTALAHTHAQSARDFEAIRAHAGRREPLAAEMEGAALAGLVRAQALLARAMAPGDPDVEAASTAADPDPEVLRRAVLAALRRRP